MLTHLISAAQCASCRLCCNFRRTSAWETPALTPDLAGRLRARGIPLRTREDGSTTFALHFPDDAPENFCANCPALDPTTGYTLPRSARPIECRLWPLRLMRAPSGGLALGLYDACPAVSPVVREQIIREATGALLPELRRIANEQPRTIRPIHPAYSIIWEEVPQQTH